MTDIASLQAITPAFSSVLLTAGALIALLSASFVPPLAFYRLCARRDKMMNTHLARQLFRLGCVLATLLGFLALAWLARMPLIPDSMKETLTSGFSLGFSRYVWWHTPLRSNVILLIVVAALLILISRPLARAWKYLDGSPIMLWIGSFMLVLFMPLFWAVLIPLICQGPMPPALAGLLSSGPSLFAIVFCLCGTGIALASCSGFIWTLLKRKENDDADYTPAHDSFLLRANARSCATGALILLLGLAALAMNPRLPSLPDAAFLALSLPAAVSLLSAMAARDGIPKRRAVLGCLAAALMALETVLIVCLTSTL